MLLVVRFLLADSDEVQIGSAERYKSSMHARMQIGTEEWHGTADELLWLNDYMAVLSVSRCVCRKY